MSKRKTTKKIPDEVQIVQEEEAREKAEEWERRERERLRELEREEEEFRRKEEREEEDDDREEEEQDDDLPGEATMTMKQMMTMLQLLDRQQRKREEKQMKQREYEERIRREQQLEEQRREREMQMEEQRQQQQIMREQQETLRELIRSQQEQNRKTLTALKPKDNIDTSIPLPRRIDQDQTIAEYLVGFEKIMRERGTPQSKWTAILPSLLNRKYSQALTNLDEDDTNDYEIVRETLMAVDVEDLLMAPRRFFEANKKQGDDFQRFLQKLETYWNHVTKKIETLKKMRQLTVMERFITFLPHQCASIVRDKKPETPNAALNYAREYFIQRGWSIRDYLGHGRWADQSGPGRRDGRDGRRNYNGGYRQGQRQQTRTRDEGDRHESPKETTEASQEKDSGDQKRQQDRKSVFKPTCYECGKVGHTKRFCRSKPDVNLVNYLGYVKMDKLLKTRGTIEGKEAAEIALDTGADVSVVCDEFVDEKTRKCGKQIAGTIGGDFEFPRVIIETEIQGRKMDLQAVAVPRRYMRKDLLLGKDTPGLGIAWWLDGIKGKETTENGKEPEHKEEPGPVDIGVVTRAQAEKERRTIESLELADEASEATPTQVCDDTSNSERDSDDNDSESEVETDTESGESEESEHTQSDSQNPTDNLPGNPYNETERLGNPTTIEHLREEQRKDKKLRPLREKAEKRVERYYYDKNKLLCRDGINELGESCVQLVLPSSQRRKAFTAAHMTLISGHLSYKKTIQKLTPFFTWPGMYSDVRHWCAACTICQENNPGNQQKAPLEPLPVVRTPWAWIAFDIVGPLHRTKRGNKYLLTCIDLATRYLEAIPVKSTDLASLIDPLFKILSQHSIPSKVLTDQGTQFTSDLFARLCDKIGITHVTTTPYRPQSNGCVERMHKTLKACLRKCPESKEDWDLLVPYILFALREAPHSSTGHSPFTLLYGRQVRGPVSILSETWQSEEEAPTSLETALDVLRDRLKKTAEIAQQKDQESKKARKSHYDKQAQAKPFDIGDKVLVRTPPRGREKVTQWSGPYIVLDKPSNVTYELNTRARKRKSRIYHRNSLKTYIDAVNYMQVKIATGSDEEGIIPHPSNVSEIAGERPSNLFSLQHLTDDQRRQMEEVLEQNLDVFSQDLREPAAVDPVVLETGNTYPIFQRSYQVPEKLVPKVKEELDDLLRQGIIRQSTSPWNSPAVIVRKLDGRIRLCVNYQRLNAVTTTDPFPLPNIDILISKASRSKWITTLDLTKGFHQIPVNPTDIPKTSFSVPWGKFEYVKMPFGIKNGPSHFQRLMNALLGNTDRADIYIDDIVIYSQDYQQHLNDLKTVFDILRKRKLRASPSKAVLARHTLNFLGHTIGQGQISPQTMKITAIQNYVRPTNKKGIRAFLGASGFYRKFIPNYSKIAAPLYSMTSKNAPDKLLWNQNRIEAFNNLRLSLTSDTVLIAPSYDKPFLLCTDASTRGVGAVLCQTDSQGRERPIAYFSKQLKQHQRNYAVTELELLAIILAIQHFQVYLTGATFTIITDHRALLHADKLKSANGRLARWALFLQTYDYTIQYRPGRLNTNADALSRQEQAPQTPGGVLQGRRGDVDP